MSGRKLISFLIKIKNVDNSEELANMKVYYNEQEYLEYSISQGLLEKVDALNDIIKCLIAYVDDSLNKSVFV